MGIGKRITPQLGNLVVNKPAFNNMGDIVNKFRNINFDKSKFIVREAGESISISLRDTSAQDSEDFEHHFQVLANTASNTTVDVHAGYWVRYYDGYDPVWGNMAQAQMVTTDGSGLSREYDNIYNLGGFAEGINYVMLQLDDPLVPTASTPITDVTYPFSGMFTRDRIVIAAVNVASSVVVGVEQYWTGGDIVDCLTYETDECSLELDTTDRHLQLHEFTNNSTTALSNINDADRIIKVQDSTGCVGYSLWSNCVADVISHIPALDCSAVNACISAFVDCAYIDGLACGYLKTVAHSDLTDIIAGTCGDHHWTGFAAGNVTYLKRDGDASRNACTYIGDTGGNASIQTNSRLLYGSVGDINIDWNTLYLASAGVTRVDWANCQLTGAATWYATNNFAVTLQCTADEFELNDAADNYWNHDIFYVAADTTAIVEAPSATIRAGAMSCSIECASAGPDINIASAGGELNIDGSECLSTSAYAIVDPDTGDLYDATWLHGFLIGVT